MKLELRVKMGEIVGTRLGFSDNDEGVVKSMQEELGAVIKN